MEDHSILDKVKYLMANELDSLRKGFPAIKAEMEKVTNTVSNYQTLIRGQQK